MLKRRKYDWQAVINGEFRHWQSIEFEIFNWMLKTGSKFTDTNGRWTRLGLDQLMFGYSANNHDSYTNLFPNFREKIELGILRAITATNYPCVLRWREDQGVGIGKYRFLSFPEEFPELERYSSWNVWAAVNDLRRYKGFFLKKRLFHPDYPKRTLPKVLFVELSTAGRGYRFRFEFSFKELKYEPGWSYFIYQQERESFDMYIHRVHSEMKELIDHGRNRSMEYLEADCG